MADHVKKCITNRGVNKKTKRVRRDITYNKIIDYYRDDGTCIQISHHADSANGGIGSFVVSSDFDYARVELLGNHADATLSGNIMLVSKEDLNNIISFKWYLNKNGYPSTYGTVDRSIRFSRLVPIHQLLFGELPQGHVVDHINRNRLDNRRQNLRVCTIQENNYNRSKQSGGKNKYKGVASKKRSNVINGEKVVTVTYTATVTKDGKKHIINNIPTEIEAAKIYDAMAEELFGKYAAKNFQ